MLKCEILDVQGFEPSIHGMRNPMNSWDKSDSTWVYEIMDDSFEYEVGEADLGLMKKLFKAGTEHRKFDRMLIVWMDIEAPLYWWKEFDTYKVGTVCNSCSTMHKIHSKPFTIDDFSHEHLLAESLEGMKVMIDCLNEARRIYVNGDKQKYYTIPSGDKNYWWQLIQLLPSSYNQKRTIMLSYEVVAKIIKERSGHKLDEWKQLIDVLQELPYLKEIMD